MRKIRVKKLRQELRNMLGGKEMTKRIWRHHKRSYNLGVNRT